MVESLAGLVISFGYAAKDDTNESERPWGFSGWKPEIASLLITSSRWTMTIADAGENLS